MQQLSATRHFSQLLSRYLTMEAGMMPCMRFEFTCAQHRFLTALRSRMRPCAAEKSLALADAPELQRCLRARQG